MEKKSKEFNILLSVPEVHSKKDIKPYLKPMYIIEDYLNDDSRYGDLEQCIRNVLRGSFHIKECREYPIEFKFYRKDKISYKLQLRRFLYNLYVWRPFCILNELHILDDSFILNEEEIPNITDFLNDKILKTLQDYNIDQVIINESISNVLYNLRSISLDFSDIMNLTFSDHDFIEMMNDSEYKEIMELSIPEDMQPIEVERLLSQYQKRLIKKLKSDKENPVGIMLRAGTGIKEKQLAEYMIALGLKPTLTGEVMPIPIESSSLLGGLNRPSYQYIDAIAARKPLIMNKKSMGNAG